MDYNSIRTDGEIYYFRYPLANRAMINFMKKVNKLGGKILVEIPTYPYEDESHSNKGLRKLRTFINMFKDQHYRVNLKRYVDRIITYSRDEKIFDIKTIKISNASDLYNISARKNVNHTEINLVAVANMNYWHGYDRLIEGLYIYYKKNVRKEIVQLYLIGGGRSIEFYKKLVDKYNLNKYVFFTGILTGKELDGIYNVSDIGIDALARHRSKVYYNSSLKGKEYMAKGLPIISGVETELDYDDNFNYYMKVPADETPINVNDVIDFYYKIYNCGIDHAIAQIRNYAEKNFDFKICFNPVIQYLKTEMNKCT